MTIYEGIRVEEVEICLLCKSKGLPLYQEMRDRLLNTPGIWAFFHCPQCGLIWLNPRPLPEDIGKLYANYFTHAYNPERRPSRKDIVQQKIAPYILTHYGYVFGGKLRARFLGEVLSRTPLLGDLGKSYVMFLDGYEKGKLIDIGCGVGIYLDRMRSLGWEVLGIEPDAEAANKAKEFFGIPVVVSTLEQANLPSCYCDAVTVSHVLEHVHDPIVFLQECYRILKPHGKLVLLTPNGESLGHRIFRRAWRGLETGRHLYIFTPNTLELLVKAARFRVKSLRTISQNAVFIYSASKLIQKKVTRSEGRLPFLQLLEGVVFWLIEEMFCLVGKRVGEEILVIATKEAQEASDGTDSNCGSS